MSAVAPLAHATDPLCIGAYAGENFDSWWLRKAGRARSWIFKAGSDDAAKITSSGATPKNKLWAESNQEKDHLAVEAQRIGLSAIMAGLAGNPSAGGAIDTSLVEKGLSAIEWGLAQRSATTHGSSTDCTGGRALPTNSFPCQDGGAASGSHSLHHKTVFIEAAASGIAAVLEANELGADLRMRANAMIASLDEVASWLVASPDVDGPDGFFAKVIPSSSSYDPGKANVNQLLHVAVALGRIGTLTGKTTYKQRAKVLIRDYIFPLQTADGIFPENSWMGHDGWDVGYQTVSIDLLTTYAAQIQDDDGWRCTVLKKTQRGVDKLMSRILKVNDVRQLDGFSGHNTRTMECGPRMPGDLVAIKGERTDKIPWRIYQWALLTGQTENAPPAGAPCSTYAQCADELRKTGQNFEHQSSCADDGIVDHVPYPYAE